MIVWGGVAGGVYLNTGGRYNPVNDTWPATSTAAGVPTGRYQHTAVWTGTEMIVWGGFGNGSATNTGGRYDPRTDLWVPTSVGANVPSARLHHTAVWTGTEMIVWGGTQNRLAGTGGRYDPTTDTWLATATAGAAEDRREHTAVWTGTRMIVWGGRGGQFGVPLATGGLYDPSTNTWTATPSGGLQALSGPIAVWTGAEMIVWGGEWTTPENIGHRFDPSAGTWAETSTGSQVPHEREFHTGIWTGTHLIVWGGDPISSTGALYCACPNGALVFRDTDGDGYGQAGGAMGSCDGSLPAGTVTNDDDCNDRSGAVHPGADELCNAVDDDCDGSVDEGIGAPTSVPALSETRSGTSALLAWLPAAGATAYDVVKGDLLSLRASGGDFTASTTGCLADDLVGTTVSDPAVPAPGNGWWHLVRPVSSCGGSGTYDEGSPGQQGSRDAEIQAAAASCP